jgi:SAM-dependent methyltransferase
MQFKDYFSVQADEYARRRPTYPPELFQYLASVAPAHVLAWDCGTGNGQAARGLAPYFDHVIATDASADQLRNAFPDPKVEYRHAHAEDSGLIANTVDLVTVAQALHWFDLDSFYPEVQRTLKPGGVIAVWGYGLTNVDPDIDNIIHHFYSDTVGPYWPKERTHVDVAYQSLPFPFAEFDSPPLAIHLNWDLSDMLAYLRTWSPVRRYIEAHGKDPVDLIEAALRSAWGNDTDQKPVTFPIFIRIGRTP